MDTVRNMADNSQLDFRLKVYILELVSMASGSSTTASSVAAASPSTSVPVTTQQPTVAASDYVTRTIDTFDISRNDIDYRAEGNANIVLAIPQRCQVLRLPKKSKRLFHSFLFFLHESCITNKRLIYLCACYFFFISLCLSISFSL